LRFEQYGGDQETHNSQKTSVKDFLKAEVYSDPYQTKIDGLKSMIDRMGSQDETVSSKTKETVESSQTLLNKDQIKKELAKMDVNIDSNKALSSHETTTKKDKEVVEDYHRTSTVNLNNADKINHKDNYI
jgi:hypothetical protein